MNEQVCATCAHWKPPTERDGFGDAITINVYSNSADWERIQTRQHEVDRLFGECREIRLRTDMEVDDPVPLATVRDGSDYLATLYTQAGFGCAMWSKNDENASTQPEG